MSKQRGRPKTTVEERIAAKEWDLETVEKLAGYGLTDTQLADILNVNESTINRWKEDEDFLQALRRGKTKANTNVIEALYQRAIGFEHEDLYITQFQGQIVKEKIMKYYPPDVVAQTRWLLNRDAPNWRDKQDIELSGNIVTGIEILMPKHENKDTANI